jgi:hypothetical protein
VVPTICAEGEVYGLTKTPCAVKVAASAVGEPTTAQYRQRPSPALRVPAQLGERRVEVALLVLLRVERQVERRDQLRLHGPRRFAWQPRHSGVVFQPFGEPPFARGKGQAVSAAHAAQLNAQLFRQDAPQR